MCTWRNICSRHEVVVSPELDTFPSESEIVGYDGPIEISLKILMSPSGYLETSYGAIER